MTAETFRTAGMLWRGNDEKRTELAPLAASIALGLVVALSLGMLVHVGAEHGSTRVVARASSLTLSPNALALDAANEPVIAFYLVASQEQAVRVQASYDLATAEVDSQGADGLPDSVRVLVVSSLDEYTAVVMQIVREVQVEGAPPLTYRVVDLTTP